MQTVDACLALLHDYVAFSISLLIRDDIGHTCRTETVMTLLLTLPKRSKAQVMRPACNYEHFVNKIPEYEHRSARVQEFLSQISCLFLYKQF